MVRIETRQLIPSDPSGHHWDVIDIGLGHHRRRDIAGGEFVSRVLFPQRAGEEIGDLMGIRIGPRVLREQHQPRPLPVQGTAK
jgi:hypothetical protein